MNKEAVKKMSILAIDDEPMMLRLIKQILEKDNFEVYLASDGISGLAILEEKKPDLVLLDIMMPGMSGLEVLDKIRKTSDVPVIMVSASPERISLEPATDSGVDDYITKPFYPAVLLARVHAKLRRIEMEKAHK